MTTMNSAIERLYPSQGSHGAVVHALGSAIVTGQYPPGSPIPTEEQLTTQFGVSRSVVREATRVLRGKGLVKSTVGRGTIVQPTGQWHLLDPDILVWRYTDTTAASAMDDLTGLRLFLEPAAARQAAQNPSRRIADPIEDAFERMKNAVEDTEEFVDADLAFHAAIVAATENELLIHLNSMLAVALRAQRRLHTTSKTRHRRTLPAHKRVLDAIRDHEPDRAEAEARDIIERAHQDILYYSGRAKRSGASRRSDPKE